ncbi:hypothetical protein SELMODRAFT_160785 [Selaginella moellendorffii]|uniref:Peroxisomal adenine nucleotide carrier 1 n=1 Tax=Selaginella moellendorffii TaxID=88036 RepID=D8T3Y1_SELML|nr:peroxisomal adenine nucleotide carrier 1 [Selaginella moellendorffii]EFJ08606.1 hypothetical protein SELMODRAFT_160785 [Selaginella moellendorffii]|eukprot:XP_002990337.1 peroxisomal adenine nucleotide carrier 1 [Selaginella moellendorffii]
MEALADATAGAIGGLFTTTILYPLDTCKSKYQAELKAGNSYKYRSLLDVLREAIASNRVLALYQGLGAKNLQSLLSQFIYFYSYSYLKRLYLQRSKNKSMGLGANLVVAAAAGACNSIVTQPLDTASSRMQTSGFGKSKGLWATLSANWKESFDGLGASLFLTCNPAIQYTVFEQLKTRLLQQRVRKAGSSPLVLSAFHAFLLGAISKTVATLITYPAIRCKVMIQSGDKKDDEEYSRPKRMVDAFTLIQKQEGILGFYKGIQAQVLKTILSAAFLMMIKEKVSRATWVFMLAFQRWNSSRRRSFLLQGSKA